MANAARECFTSGFSTLSTKSARRAPVFCAEGCHLQGLGSVGGRAYAGGNEARRIFPKPRSWGRTVQIGGSYHTPFGRFRRFSCVFRVLFVPTKLCLQKRLFAPRHVPLFFTVTVPPCSQRPRKPIEVTVAAAGASLHRRRGLAAAISERYGTPARGWRFTYVAACAWEYL